MAVALLSDVAARLGRTPLPDEQTALIARLEDAEAAIMARISGLVLQAGSDPRFRANLITVECQVALRAAGIPMRLDNVVPAPGQVHEMADGRPGFISIRNEEWRMLGIHQMDVWNPYPSYSDIYAASDYPDTYGPFAGWRPWGYSYDEDCW